VCRRDTNDVLVRRFLDRYKLNLLALPGRRVRCGSVYVQQDGRLTAPGMLEDLIEPEVKLKKPFVENDLPDLSGRWSESISADVGIGLLESFLSALGAVGLVDELKASVKATRSRNVAFRFRKVGRESLNPLALGNALIGHRFVPSNPWVRDGNRYFAVAAVVRSASISIQGRDKGGSTVDLGVGVATVADANAAVQVEHAGASEVVYSGSMPLAIAVELYELRWNEEREELDFLTPKGPVSVLGAAEDNIPDPVFLGDNDEVLIEPEERDGEP
jgi:hypothetical protein